MSNNQWRWREGEVNTANEHFVISYGEWGDQGNRLVALVGPPKERCFIVQFLMREVPNQPEISTILIEVKVDLDRWLIDHPGRRSGKHDPWKYLIHYAGNSEAEMRSMVHWNYYQEGDTSVEKEQLGRRNMGLLKECYQELIEKFGSDIEESFDAVNIVNNFRLFWKPDKVKVVLLAESHVKTTIEDVNILIDKTRVPAGYPDHYAKFVYCLAYGENGLTQNQNHPKRDGTPQFWKVFYSCLHLVNDNDDFSPILKTTPYEIRLKNKIELLNEMKRRGIWLVDTSIVALYDDGHKVRNMNKIARSSWNHYTQNVVKECSPRHIICIGQGVAEIVATEIKGKKGFIGDIPCSIIPQPNAHLKTEEHINNYQEYFRICREYDD